MVTSRRIEESDKALLEASIQQDVGHRDLVRSGFYYDPRALTNVYEFDGRPVIFARASKALRLYAQFVDNKDTRRNAVVLARGMEQLKKTARENGFTEIILCSASESLSKFLQRLGFYSVNGELCLSI